MTLGVGLVEVLVFGMVCLLAYVEFLVNVTRRGLTVFREFREMRVFFEGKICRFGSEFRN